MIHRDPSNMHEQHQPPPHTHHYVNIGCQPCKDCKVVVAVTFDILCPLSLLLTVALVD